MILFNLCIKSIFPLSVDNNRLLSTSGKPMSTPLNSLLSMRNVKIPTDRNDPNYKDRTLLETYKKNALTLTFRGTRTAPTSKVEWEQQNPIQHFSNQESPSKKKN